MPRQDNERDLVRIEEPALTPSPEELAAHNEQALAAAHGLDEQLTQLAAWKHQLTTQMDLLRRDGLKVLERQRQLAARQESLDAQGAELKVQEDTLARERTDLAAQRDVLAQEVQRLADERAQLHQQRQENTAAAEAVAMHLTQVARREQEMAQQQADLVREQTALEEARQALEGQRAAFAQAREALAKDQDAIETDRATVAAARQEMEARLREREADLKRREDELADQMAGFGREAERLKARRAEVEAQAAALAQSHAALAQAQADVDHRVQALEVAQADLETQLSAARAENAQLQQQTAHLQQQAQEQAAALASQDHPDASLQARCDQLTTDNATFAARQGELEAQLAALQTEKTRLADEQAKVDQHLTELEAKGAELDAALEAAGRVAADEHEANLQLKAHNAQLQSELKALSEDAARLHASLDSQLGDLGRQRREDQQALTAVRHELAAAQQALTQATMALESARAEATSAKTEVARLRDMRTRETGKEIGRLTARIEELEAEVAELVGQRESLGQQVTHLQAQLREPQTAAAHAPLEPALRRQRERLVRQVRLLRARGHYTVAARQELAARDAELERTKAQVKQSQEQVRVRREHLEQIRRLLEKQELVMSRKLANHSAIKTVAAVGIFVVMVLGLVFTGVYRFVAPVYRSEAVLQLVPPAELKNEAVPVWLARQADGVRTDLDVLHDAWRRMRNEGYGVHDSRENWLAALPGEMEIKLDPASRTAAVRITGPSAEGVAITANAIVGAYADKITNLKPENGPRAVGSAVVVGKATPPLGAVSDRRMSLALSVTAGVLFVSLIAVMVLRRKIVRDLRAIDHMADEEDLAGVGEDVPVQAPLA